MKRKLLFWCFIFLATGWSLAGTIEAGSLFKGRNIQLSNDDNHLFRIGITGTTAGYNFIALIKTAKQEPISLGDLGYWEKVPDPPSFLRNYDLQLFIKNNYNGKFQIEFEYDSIKRDIEYRITEGAIKVNMDSSKYYPMLTIDSVITARPESDTLVKDDDSKRFLFFDFNSFDVDLRKYYGKVKILLKNPDYSPYFYYYESANYNSYYFKTYQSVGQLDTEKMGLSSEDATLEYYQKILDNLKSRMGTDFADQIIIVTRFGKKHSKQLKKYSKEIGLSKHMVTTFWAYDEIK